MKEDNYQSQIERLLSEIAVLKDHIRMSRWHLGTDKQSSPPTPEETATFLQQVRTVLESERT